jgi:hypothetical protein
LPGLRNYSLASGYVQKSEVRSQKSEVRRQKSEVRRQKSEVRRQKSEVRRQMSDKRLVLTPDLCLLASGPGRHENILHAKLA